MWHDNLGLNGKILLIEFMSDRSWIFRASEADPLILQEKKIEMWVCAVLRWTARDLITT